MKEEAMREVRVDSQAVAAASSPAGEVDDAAAALEPWIIDLTRRGAVTAKGREVLAMIRQHPRDASFSPVRELADKVGVNIGTITRTAQSLGFSGWSELQRELRSRYLASLSASQVAEEHRATGSDAAAAFAHDRADLAYIAQSTTTESVRQVAHRIAGARRTVIFAQGGYAGVGISLAHYCSLAGYDVRHVAEPATVASILGSFGPDDLLITINSWQMYASSVAALDAATEAGAGTVLITDTTNSFAGTSVNHRLVAPAESVSFFPSLVGAMSVCQAIVVELAALDPGRSRAQLARAEREWERFALLRPGIR
jgi:DNA-binding MurR/RpiR family transcriptional regulator